MEEGEASSDHAEEKSESGRRRKKRGSGGHNTSREAAIPTPFHLMYREVDDGESSREREDEERVLPMLESPLERRRTRRKLTTEALTETGASLSGIDWHPLHWLLRYPL